MIYHFKSLVLVRKGRPFYETLYQEVFFGNPGGGGSLRCARFLFHISFSYIIGYIIFQLKQIHLGFDQNLFECMYELILYSLVLCGNRSYILVSMLLLELIDSGGIN